YGTGGTTVQILGFIFMKILTMKSHSCYFNNFKISHIMVYFFEKKTSQLYTKPIVCFENNMQGLWLIYSDVRNLSKHLFYEYYQLYRPHTPNQTDHPVQFLIYRQCVAILN